MGSIGIRIDTSKSKLEYLHPFDIELSILLLQCVCLVAVQGADDYPEDDRQQHWNYSRSYNPPGEFPESRRSRFLRLDGLQIKEITYTNPFSLWGTIKSLSPAIISDYIQSLIFYKQASRRKELENELTAEEVKARKLQNLEKMIDLRQRLIAYGANPDEALLMISHVMDDQKAIIVPGDPKILIPDRVKASPTKGRITLKKRN